MLNVGCGAQFHPEWFNLDLVAVDKSVRVYDIRKGLPYPRDFFDAVYHSHLLEHLTPEQGRHLLAECHRVLRPGGVLRIVVPDLERIARLYLEMLEQAWHGDAKAAANYRWMKLEMLDQLVRHRSGGLMGPYMMDPQITNLDFVKSRIGKEYDWCADAYDGNRAAISHRASRSVKRWLTAIRQTIVLKAVRVLLGKDCRDAFAEGLFRQQGEVHRWMYDRYSLSQMCHEVGLGDFQICSAGDSMIDDFAQYELDMSGDQIRKPDSLFVESRKKAQAVRMAA